MDTLANVTTAGDNQLERFLPAESPIEMSVQPLRQVARQPNSSHFSPLWSRRACILAGTMIMTGAACYEMYQVLQVGGVTTLEWIVLVLFVLLFAWVAFSFMSTVAGFFVLLFRTRDALGIDPGAALPAIRSKTAMLLPTYNEDPYRVQQHGGLAAEIGRAHV